MNRKKLEGETIKEIIEILIALNSLYYIIFRNIQDISGIFIDSYFF